MVPLSETNSFPYRGGRTSSPYTKNISIEEQKSLFLNSGTQLIFLSMGVDQILASVLKKERNLYPVVGVPWKIEKGATDRSTELRTTGARREI